MTTGIPFSYVGDKFGIPTSLWSAAAAIMLVQLLICLTLYLEHKKPKATKIDDLPDSILVEILARLACKRTLFRAKCVSKRWSSLLSDPDFVKIYLTLQGLEGGNAFIGSGIICALPRDRYNKLTPELKIYTHPEVKIKERCFSLDFLPRKELVDRDKENVQLHVVATYYDLVLCREIYTVYKGTFDDKPHISYTFYICNPYTKQWMALPPNKKDGGRIISKEKIDYPLVNYLDNPSYYKTQVGFFCEPYLKYSEETSMVTFDARYKWSVVQMAFPLDPLTCAMRMDIFSSCDESQEWKTSVLKWSAKDVPAFGLSSEVASCNGKFYGLFSFDYHVVEVSPNDEIDQFRIGIKGPSTDAFFLGVCNGRLRVCGGHNSSNNNARYQRLSVWEWKDQNWCLIVDRLSMSDLVLKPPLVHEDQLRYHRAFNVLSFHPYNEDVVFLWAAYEDGITMCNMRERTLEILDHGKNDGIDRKRDWFDLFPLRKGPFFPFDIPWLPTPVPLLH